MKREIKPIVKWAGGKAQLLDKIIPMIPTFSGTYYEPFFGSGALYFAIQKENAIVNDINSELISLYTHVRENPDYVYEHISLLDERYLKSDDKKAFYYHERDEYNNNLKTFTVEQAARFIFLNKHCFNGLYRVNSKGCFNVPFNNNYRSSSQNKENILKISGLFNKAKMMNVDFEIACETAKKGDFVFFDSPYAPLNPTSFIDYTKEGFDYNDHVRLANLFEKLSTKGVYCMLTNHNTDLIRELYKNFNIETVEVTRSINSKAYKRKGEEVIITNYCS